MNQEQSIRKLTEIRCEEIIEYASKNKWFNTDFVESVYGQLQKGHKPSAAQINSVKNIHEMIIKAD